MEFSEIQKLVYSEYKKNGFEEEFNKHDAIGDIAELGLITTEISEAIETIRYSNTRKHLCFELADIVIRVLNFANRKGINLEFFIQQKNDINQQRNKFHGNKNI